MASQFRGTVSDSFHRFLGVLRTESMVYLSSVCIEHCGVGSESLDDVIK